MQGWTPLPRAATSGKGRGSKVWPGQHDPSRAKSNGCMCPPAALGAGPASSPGRAPPGQVGAGASQTPAETGCAVAEVWAGGTSS